MGDNEAIKTNGTSYLEEDERLCEEIEIPVPWGIVAGKWWGSRHKQPVLALHGWQDNAGSFDRLIPLLPKDMAFLCIDLPGHGKSSKYPDGMHYFLFWDGISLIRRISKHFLWEKIRLLGHSLGGALSFMYAASFPEDVEAFISIDINGPPIRDHKKNACMTGKAIDHFLKYETLPESKIPCYTYDEMIDLVVDAYEGSVDRDSVKVLMRRGMARVPESLHKEGYMFSRDLRLKVASMGMFSEVQVVAFAEQIRCRVLNIRAVPGMVFERFDVYENVIEIMKRNAKEVVFQTVPGTHHLHLNTPERLAPIITDFLTN